MCELVSDATRNLVCTLEQRPHSQGEKTMPAFLTILLTASHIALGANRVPEFNVEPSCLAAAEAAVAPKRDAKVCEREELTARGELKNEWGQFTPTQKAHCMSLSRLGGSPSYVELLTCLELAKAAKGLPPRDHMTGQDSSDWGSAAAWFPVFG
jgi:hypothetical protein